MDRRMQNMTYGSPWKLLISFALPLMLGNVFQQLYTLVDTMVVGKALGVQALAAVGAADWLNWMMLSVIQGFTQGFAILMAQQFGAREEENLRSTVGASAIVSAVSAVILTAVGQAAIHPVLTLLKTPPEIMNGSVTYLRVMFCGVPVVMAYNLLACILRALGDSRTPLHAMIVASFVNIALDLLFVLVFHWGIGGAAAATVIAQVFSGLFCLSRMQYLEVLKLHKCHFRLTAGMTLRLLGLGWPMAFQNAIISVGGMIVQRVVNSVSVLFIAGFTATNKLYGLLEIAASSYGYAMITYTGQNLGAGETRRIRKGTSAAVWISLVTSVFIAAVMIIFGKFILSGFVSGSKQEIEQTLKVAYYYLVIMSLSLPVLYILHVTRSAIQGMGDTFLPMVSGVAEFVMRTGAALLLPMLVGDVGIFFAEVLAWLGADFVLIPSYFCTIRKIERCYGGNIC